MTPLETLLDFDAAQYPLAGFLFATTIRATLFLAVATLAIFLLRRASAAARHRMWFAAVAGLALLPAATCLLPAWSVPLPGETAAPPAPSIVASSDEFAGVLVESSTKNTAKRATAPRPTAAAPAPATVVAASEIAIPTTVNQSPQRAVFPEITGPQWFAAIWAAGACLAGLLVTISAWSAGILVRKSQPVTDDRWRELLNQARAELSIARDVELRTCDRAISPMTWGWRRPVILLSRDADAWTDDCRRAVLLHELAHVARRDWPVQMLTAVVGVVYWFHPLVWWAARELRQESDRAADDMALAAGMPAATYAEQLLHVAGQLAAQWLHPAPTMARRGRLTRRIGALLDPKQNRRPTSGRTSATILLFTGCAVVLAAVISVRAADAEGSDKDTDKPAPTTESTPSDTSARQPADGKLKTENVGDGEAAIGTPDPRTRREQIETALKQSVSLNFNDQPLTDAADHLSNLLKLDIVFDVAALNEEGISPDTPITCSLRNISCEFALTLLLDPLQLTAIIEDDVLKITTKVAAEDKLETRVYDINKLFGEPFPLRLTEMLRQVIITCVASDTWESVGGPGVIPSVRKESPSPTAPPQEDEAGLAGILVIRQTGKVHREIQEFLAELKRSLIPDSNKTRTITKREFEQKRIRKALEAPIGLDFVDRPLSDVVVYCQDWVNDKVPGFSLQAPLNFVIDTTALNEEGISPDTPVTFNIRQIPLKKGLRLMLQPLQLKAVPYGEVLLITTAVKAQELLDVRIYNVSDLPVRDNAAVLMQTIEATVVPDSWEKVGGAGKMTPFGAIDETSNFMLLLVRQTEQGHEEVAALLEQLRRTQQ